MIKYSPPINPLTPKFIVATGYLFQIKRPERAQTTITYRNGSISLIYDNNQTMIWIVPPKSYFVDFDEEIMTDGTRKIIFANGTIIKDSPPPLPEASEKERANAIIRLVDFGNGT